jgi:hypothetical protein
VSWEVDGNNGRIDLTVPPGTAADLVTPDGGAQTKTSGSYTVPVQPN